MYKNDEDLKIQPLDWLMLCWDYMHMSRRHALFVYTVLYLYIKYLGCPRSVSLSSAHRSPRASCRVCVRAWCFVFDALPKRKTDFTAPLLVLICLLNRAVDFMQTRLNISYTIWYIRYKYLHILLKYFQSRRLYTLWLPPFFVRQPRVLLLNCIFLS